jgi:hypothetical protein
MTMVRGEAFGLRQSSGAFRFERVGSKSARRLAQSKSFATHDHHSRSFAFIRG